MTFKLYVPAGVPVDPLPPDPPPPDPPHDVSARRIPKPRMKVIARKKGSLPDRGRLISKRAPGAEKIAANEIGRYGAFSGMEPRGMFIAAA